MKNPSAVLWVVFTLFITPNMTFGADFNMSIDSSKSSILNYDSKSQYINIKIKNLMVPVQQEPAWYKKIFVKRKNFGIGYFEFSFVDGSIVKQIVFQYEKVSSSEYKYDYLLPTPEFPAYILEKKLSPRPISMKLVIKNWENKDNISLVKGLITKLNLFSSSFPEITSQQLSKVLQVGTVAIDLVETVYPPLNTEESGTITIDPENLRDGFLLKLRDSDGNFNEFSNVDISTSESLFHETSGLLDETLKKYPEIFDQKELKIWEKNIQDTDSQSSNNASLMTNSISSFGEYVKSLKLTNTDKVILLAKGVCRWAPNTQDNQTLTAKQFSNLSVDGAQKVLNRYQNSLLQGCSFPGGDCNLPITCATYDFYSKSKNRTAKKFTKKYILESFQLKIENNPPIDITYKEYLDSFYITGSSTWTPSGPLKDRKYTFDKQTINVAFKGEEYTGYTVSIFVIEVENNFYITQIQLSKQQT